MQAEIIRLICPPESSCRLISSEWESADTEPCPPKKKRFLPKMFVHANEAKNERQTTKPNDGAE